MRGSARLFNCARCRCQVVLCSHCDRGQIYCGRACAQAARRQSARAAGRRYQRSRRGRFAHAERQRRYRQRCRSKVTHQGSPPARSAARLPAESRRSVGPHGLPVSDPADGIRCHRCGRVCRPFLRHTVRQRRPDREAIDWPPSRGARARAP
jgi:hypothetical protein